MEISKRQCLRSGYKKVGYLKIDIYESNPSRQYLIECTTDFDTMQKYMELADLYIPVRYRDNYKAYCLQNTELSENKAIDCDNICLKNLIIDNSIESELIDNELVIKMSQRF